MTNKDFKKIKEFYENNISEDIVYVKDTLQSSTIKIDNKLENNLPFFLVVLDNNEKFLGIIGNKELKEMLEQAKSKKSLEISFGSNYVHHTILMEDENIVKALEELKKDENKGFILVKNKKGNYVGKIFLSKIIKS